MPTADENKVILEISEYSLHALRVSKGVVEAGGECLLENKAAVEALLDAVAPARKTEGLPVTVGVWPGQAGWHVSTSTEAMLDRTPDAIRAIAIADQKEPILFAVCNANDGGAVVPEGLDKWVLAHSPQEAQMKVGLVLKSLNADAEGATPAALASLGTVTAAIKRGAGEAPVIVWDLGAKTSTLILVTGDGADACAPCAIGVESIFEAVQQALKLKFRGAAERLFFNETYDFTDAGPKIGAAIAARLKEAVAALPAAAGTPALTCLGLTAKQSWFVRESAAAAGLVPWTPDLAAVASGLGLTFAGPEVQGQFSTASVGLLGIASSTVRGGTDWLPDWLEAEPVAEAAAPEPEEAPEPEPAPPPRPAAPAARPKPSLSTEPSAGAQVTFSTKPSSKPPVPQRSVSLPPVPSQAPQPGSTRPPIPTTPQVRLSPPVPAAAPAPSFPSPAAPTFPSPGGPSFPPPAGGGRPPSFSNPGFPAPSGAGSFSNPGFPVPAPRSAAGAPPPPHAGSFSNPGFPMPEPAGAPVPPPAPAAPAMKLPEPAKAPAAAGGVTALPFEAVKTLKPLPPAAAAAAKEPPKSRVGFYIGIGVVAALVFAAIAVVVEARLEKIKAYDLEQQEALAHHMAELQLKQAEAEKAAQEEQSRKDLEAAILRAKKEQEEETSKRVRAELEAERLSKMPGILSVDTSPAGALLSVDGGAPLKTPAKVEGLSPGSHRVQITLSGHESVDTSVEILGSKTTDLGTLALPSIYGSVDLTSTPDGLEFAIRPAADPSAKPVRTGHTPASFNDIPHGSYVVTFSRPGCKDHTVAVEVQKATKSPVDTRYLDGSLELTSDPSGANVNKDGSFLGTTPLTLNNLTPKLASFELTLPGYDPTPIEVQIPEGDSLKYSAQLLRKDRVFKATEVKTAPVPVDSPAPVLSSAQRKLGADIVLSIVVRKDGSVTGVEVVSATDDDIARRCKSAVEKWRYRPATAPDDRSVQARIEVPFKFPAGAP